MEQSFLEAHYPIDFRKADAERLGEYVRERHSVELVGMRRVGISNFLRFFLNHTSIKKTYIRDTDHHLFIPVDLNDLVEREIYPFWMLTLKRIVDSVDQARFPDALKKQSRRVFMESIQMKDLFFAVDSVYKLISSVIAHSFLPTLFFIRFDRLKDAVTPEFFDNLQGLKDTSGHKLSYVFTSFRTLYELSPLIFKKPSLSVFSQTMWMKPARTADSKIILSTFEKHYHLKLSPPIASYIVDITAGHVQYLQLALIKLHEENHRFSNTQSLFAKLVSDERIVLQSEELFDSLSRQEQEVLLKIKKGERSKEAQKQASYLWNTGFICEKNGGDVVFSPLLDYYLGQKSLLGNDKTELTKKEHLLFTFLKIHQREICEREDIIQGVWPEYSEIGVSDWAIDRLVARLRNKLKVQGSNVQIQTVRTRGYKLVTE